MRRGRVKVSENRTLARERGRSKQEHGEERMDSTVKEGSKEEREGKQGEPPYGK